jgi:hypothetical protein
VKRFPVCGSQGHPLNVKFSLSALLGQSRVAPPRKGLQLVILAYQFMEAAQLHADGCSGAHAQYAGDFTLRFAPVTR